MVTLPGVKCLIFFHRNQEPNSGSKLLGMRWIEMLCLKVTTVHVQKHFHLEYQVDMLLHICICCS